MKNFIHFLTNVQSFLRNIPSQSKTVHFTLGNESCDLDSTISALVLGYFIQKTHPDETVIPLLNVIKQDFMLRTENCYVLEKAGISLSDLTFRNEVPLDHIVARHLVKVSLVDHHILAKCDCVFEQFVTQIYDHRPIDKSHVWDENKVKIRIELVGSCCTLIADEILNTNENLLSSALAYLLYQVIIYDTIALKVENHKATPLDIQVAQKLEGLFKFSEDRQSLFDMLWHEHNNISHLTPHQLLKKDLKLVEGIYIPGLPILAEDYLKLETALHAIESFASEYEVSCLLLVGLDASKGTIKRDMAIYFSSPEDRFKSTLLEILEGANFNLERRHTKFTDKILLLHVHNVETSRKQLVPLVKRAWFISRK
ncbi:exopolyphosphatase PRUNE1 [Euwallacea similis]|uniref:exopolyphosphatase PRUNE1 n=1 Tax=Euwallacea similis TaxID=1736056 RepID=UPI00344FFE4B